MRISDWSADVCSSDLAEPLHHAGPIALDDAVGALAQIARGGDGLGVFHVERDRRPAARQRIARVHEAAGAVDADYLCPMVGEHHAAKGAGANAGKFDDADARKRSGHVASPKLKPSDRPCDRSETIQGGYRRPPD